jgi:beta-barrel assembly-enhancing protease
MLFIMKNKFKRGVLTFIAISVVIYGCATPPETTSRKPSSPSDVEVPRSRGKELGKAFLAEALRQYQFVKDPEVTSLVTRMGREIVSAQRRDPTTYHFFVVKEASPNAFAIPGGYIFIFDSLISKFQSSDELAGVLAHEIAHVERNHFFKDEKKILAVNLATIAAILLSRGDPATITMAQAANIDFQLQYSRTNESEADTYAVQYLREAGHNPQGLLASFQTLAFYEQFNSPEDPVYFSTHPGMNERRSDLELMLRAQDTDLSKKPSVDWERILAGLRAQRLPLDHIPAMVQGLADPEHPERLYYLTGVAYLKTGHFDKAVSEYQKAITLNPDPAVYHADLSRCYFHLQKAEPAESSAKEALKRDPNQASALMVLGRLNEHKGQYQEAVNAFKKALHHHPADPQLHLQLAQSYGKLNDEAMQAYHLGRFLRLELKPREAIREFKRVQELIDDENELSRMAAQEIIQIQRDGI